MKNKKNTITPNEINKYLYCPYKWFYERYYGRKHIQALYKERNEKLNLEDKTKHNFNKGLKFHSNYFEKVKTEILFRNVIFLLIFVIVAILIIINLL